MLVGNSDIRTIADSTILEVVDYNALIPVLVEVMKEQQAKIELLKSEITLLKQK